MAAFNAALGNAAENAAKAAIKNAANKAAKAAAKNAASEIAAKGIKAAAKAAGEKAAKEAVTTGMTAAAKKAAKAAAKAAAEKAVYKVGAKNLGKKFAKVGVVVLAGTAYALGNQEVKKKMKKCKNECIPLNWDEYLSNVASDTTEGFDDGSALFEIDYKNVTSTVEQPICSNVLSETSLENRIPQVSSNICGGRFNEWNSDGFCEQGCEQAHDKGLLGKLAEGVDTATGDSGIGSAMEDVGEEAVDLGKDLADGAIDLAKDLGKDLVPPLPDLGISDFMRNMVMGIIVFIIIFIIGKQFLKRGVSRIV